MVLASLAEIVSIGAVIPFLGVLTAPDRVFENVALRPLLDAFNWTSPEQLVLPLTIVFCMAALLAGILRVALLWASMRLTYATGADISIDIYRKTLYQKYSVHVSRSSSEIINGIMTKTNASIAVVMSVLTIIGASVTLISVLLIIFLINPLMASIAFGGFGLIYACITLLVKKRLEGDSARIAGDSTRLIKALQEGLGGIRDILIDGSQYVYCQTYRRADLSLRRAQGNINIIGSIPRFAIETLGMTLIAVMAFVFSQKSQGIADFIPALGALALGAQRLLPAMQQVYSSWSSIKGTQVSLEDTLALLDQPLPGHANSPISEKLPFRDSIVLKGLSFRYGIELPWVLMDVDLTIPKGSRIGFVGTTGSGKSTLLDIVMGLLQPSDGQIQIDGETVSENNNRRWQAHIAHVPQDIFLADCSVEENIAFGVSKSDIDSKLVLHAANQAQIGDIIESWPKKYQTVVGERGVQLSGGQRQRIGIARALYKKADVIIFDEATSSLDSATEKSVMASIDALSSELTMLIIAHRTSTLANCSDIVELASGKISRVISYNDLMD